MTKCNPKGSGDRGWVVRQGLFSFIYLVCGSWHSKPP